MESRTGLILFLALLTISLTSTQVYGQMTPADNKAKQVIFTNLSNTVNNHYDQYKGIAAITKDNQTHIIFNNTGGIIIPPPPICPTGEHWNSTAGQCVPDVITPPVEICGDGIDNDGDGLVDEGCPILPPPTPDKPSVDVNTSKILRVAAIGDIDNNGGLDTQLALANKYNVEVFIVAGDYGYSDCQAVLNKIKNADFEKAVIIQGNHDCSSTTKAFNNLSTLYGQFDFTDKLSIFGIDANQGFGCSTAQFAETKDHLESSDAWYNIPVVHQPFVTVKSQHSANGEFSCWNPLFAGNGVKLVLQAHNHNYQRIDVNGIDYMVVGTGTHDTGGSMYPLNSDNWNGFSCQKCITGTNGITIMDFQIDEPAVRHMDAWFLSNSEQVKDKFN